MTKFKYPNLKLSLIKQRYISLIYKKIYNIKLYQFINLVTKGTEMKNFVFLLCQFDKDLNPIRLNTDPLLSCRTIDVVVSFQK